MKKIITALVVATAMTVIGIGCGGGETNPTPTPTPSTPTPKVEAATVDGEPLAGSTIKTTSIIVITVNEDAADATYAMTCDGADIPLDVTTDGLQSTLRPTADELPQLASCSLTANMADANASVSKAVIDSISFSTACGLKQALFVTEDELEACWNPNLVGFNADAYAMGEGAFSIIPDWLIEQPTTYEDIMAFGYKRVQGTQYSMTVDLEAILGTAVSATEAYEVLATMGIVADIGPMFDTSIIEHYDTIFVGIHIREPGGKEDGVAGVTECVTGDQAGSEGTKTVDCPKSATLKIERNGGVFTPLYSTDGGTTFQKWPGDVIFDTGSTLEVVDVGVGAYQMNTRGSEALFSDLVFQGDVTLFE